MGRSGLVTRKAPRLTGHGNRARKRRISPQSAPVSTQRPIHQEYLEAAHERNKKERYTDLMRQRRIWSEGTFAILKACHGLRRAIRRGLDNVQEQLLIASTALNMRRMVAVMNKNEEKG